MKKSNTFGIKFYPQMGMLFIILYCVFIVSSCDKVVDYEKPLQENKIVIESYITEGDTAVNVRITKSGSPYEITSVYDPKYYILDADVKIIFDDSDTIFLELNKSPRFPVKTTYSKKIKVPSAHKCYLEVGYKGQKVYAEEYYPLKTKINSASITLEKTNNGINTKFKINANFPKQETNYYRIQAYGKFVYNNGVSNQKRLWSTGYVYFSADGTSNIQNISFSPNSYSTNLNNIENKAIIYLEHISPFYVQFLNAVEEQVLTVGDEFNTEIVQIPTNIEGGLGIFTVIARDSIWADITIK